MNAPALRGRGVPSRAGWFGASGYSTEVDSLADPRAYAQHLISYLRDDSTVRARVADRYGARLSIAEIAALRLEAELSRARREHVVRVGEPEDSDEYDFRVSARPFRWQDEALAKHGDPAQREARAREAAATFVRTTRHVSTPKLLAAIGMVIGVPASDLCGSGKAARIMRGRSLAYAVLRGRGNTWARVAAMLGDRTHASAMHGARQFFDKWIREPDLLSAWRSLAPSGVASAETFEEMEIQVRAGRSGGRDAE
ncbi:hypothetical protein [Novosphingobium lindaniclasticum]|uniref:Chromosomal replication initiator DnaA C-terminal domain-containing protein n=1 Tax=Novosphingobium lindaniclasticum LE124 TaxID=1096930 RepID=T0HC68_9SPHN|nr:hypothetical protein [Novosphingobium lindaniclasticum]EQB09723.1 hypothetical protein L284_19175 [Novosphingobium lindaniclasticum LE124]